MAYITGAQTNIILKQGSTYETAVEGATGDKLIDVQVTPSTSAVIGEANGIGSGLTMAQDVDKLREDFGLTLAQSARYDDAGLSRVMALFLGAVTAPVEQNTGEGDYLHKFYHSATANKFCTVAYNSDSAGVFEYPSCYVRSVSITTGQTPGYLNWTADLLANDQDITSTVNDTASLAAATVLGSTKVVHSVTAGKLWINAQGGDALDSGDAINADTVTINYSKPKILVNTFGTSEVINDDLFTAELVITFPTLKDLTYFTAQQAGTAYKALFFVEGSQIGAGDNNTIAFAFPKLKVLDRPQYAVTDSGANPLSVTLRAFAATANPTGMDYTTPYGYVINANSAALIS